MTTQYAKRELKLKLVRIGAGIIASLCIFHNWNAIKAFIFTSLN